MCYHSRVKPILTDSNGKHESALHGVQISIVSWNFYLYVCVCVLCGAGGGVHLLCACVVFLFYIITRLL